MNLFNNNIILIKKNPLLSICIPTYNRAKLLQECLNSLVSQFSNQDIKKKVEIIISNNNSKDDTEKIVKKFQKKYRNIRYFKNKKNIGIKNTMRVATLAAGKYIWFFADDDWHKKKSLKTVLNIVDKYQPELILTNLDLYSKNGIKIIDSNLLRITKNDFFGSKKSFFHFLEDKFYLPVDWYLTTYSNTIIKRDIFNSNYFVLNQYANTQFVFPHKYFIFFVENDYKIYVIAKTLINFRANNRSFGSKNKKEFLIDWYSKLKIHYDLIHKINSQYISLKFTFLLMIKQLLRSARLLFLQTVDFDISEILMEFFYHRET